METSFKRTQEYLDTQAQIVEKLKLIPPIDKEINAVNEILNSLGFKFLNMIGLEPDDFRSDTFDLDTVLPKLANTNLSQRDLVRKASLLNAQKLQLLEEINGLEAVLRQLEENAKFDVEKQKQELLQAKQQAFVAAYDRDPLSFLAGVLSAAPSDLASDRTKLYTSADQIIAVSAKFNQQIQKPHLWKAWQIVATARDLAIAQKNPRDIEQYVTGADQTFAAILKQLPDGAKDLAILYKAEQFDKANNYLEQILLSDMLADPDKLQLMRSDIEEQKRILSQKELQAIAGERKRKFSFPSRN